jgi:mevalonate kinase
MKIRAPGKLILSGEHAIVYGKPALAMAVNRYAEAQTSEHNFPLVSFDLSDLAYRKAIHFAALDQIKERIKQKYRGFLRGEFKIRHVLQKPVELAQFALSLFYEILNIKPTQGVKIKLQSDIPMGCGMGSSAAIVLSVIHAMAHHLDLSLPQELLYRLGLEAENIQHGYSSGLDLRISQQGGCLLMQNQQIQVRTLPQTPLYIINTGTPVSSTGECVAAVAPHFTHSTIGNDFADVTLAMDAALQANQPQALRQAINANQALLVKIGVVPPRVQAFAQSLELADGAAKICGAGAVSGDNGGIVLAVIEDLAALTDLCAQYRYTLMPVYPEARGVHVV